MIVSDITSYIYYMNSVLNQFCFFLNILFSECNQSVCVSFLIGEYIFISGIHKKWSLLGLWLALTSEHISEMKHTYNRLSPLCYTTQSLGTKIHLMHIIILKHVWWKKFCIFFKWHWMILLVKAIEAWLYYVRNNWRRAIELLEK